MSQPLRIEDCQQVNLLTSRTQNSRLWFVNNKRLETEILGSLAKYQERHGVALYAFALQGNHDHLSARFPRGNRAPFMRDLNAQIARLAIRLVNGLGRGKYWERRYAHQELPRNEDIEEYFFYCALQTVLSGLAEHPSEYPGYNSFDDAVNGRECEYTVTDWTRYNNARRWNAKVDITRYQSTHKLVYQRLPGYEHLSQEAYRDLMYKKLEERRLAIVAERKKAGKGFLGQKALKNVKPGARPHITKTSTRTSHRPLVLSACQETKQHCLERYFCTLDRYKQASIRYLKGEITVRFPTGTYRPPMLCAA